jgi:hypothetical protein
MAMDLVTRVEIKAPAKQVWVVLTDFNNYVQWNTLTPRTKTDHALGHRMLLRMYLSCEYGMLRRWEKPGEELGWDATIGPRWFCRIQRVQRIEPLDASRCSYVNQVTFTGMLTWFFDFAQLQVEFDRMAAELARHAKPRGGADVLEGKFLFRGQFRPSEPLATPARADYRPAPVDKSSWHPCHACGVPIPVDVDYRYKQSYVGERRSHTIIPTGTVTYVCPHCCATQVGAERLYDAFNTPQTQCHVCEHPLGDSLACPNCGMLQYWTVVGCTTCGAKQAVHVPHLTDSCDVYTLQCVACETVYCSLCIC